MSSSSEPEIAVGTWSVVVRAPANCRRSDYAGGVYSRFWVSGVDLPVSPKQTQSGEITFHLTQLKFVIAALDRVLEDPDGLDGTCQILGHWARPTVVDDWITMSGPITGASPVRAAPSAVPALELQYEHVAELWLLLCELSYRLN